MNVILKYLYITKFKKNIYSLGNDYKKLIDTEVTIIFLKKPLL